jgi:hypothetical protein
MPYKDKEKQKKFQADWYKKVKNTEVRKNSQRNSKKALVERNRDTVHKAKQAGCQVCGYNKCTGALEFHHLDRNQKDLGIAKAIRMWGTEKLTEEINKCILLCANCHREAHYNQNNAGKVLMDTRLPSKQ